MIGHARITAEQMRTALIQMNPMLTPELRAEFEAEKPLMLEFAARIP